MSDEPIERVESDEAGRVRRRYFVRGDQLDGELAQLDEEGRPEATLHYVDGVLEGEALFYDKGRLQLSMQHRGGVEEGERVLYGENGKPSMKVTMRAGKQHGLTSWFRPDGTLMRTAEFADGEMGEVADYDAKGRKLKGRK